MLVRMAAMNNFPAMTEEQRQELVKHCKNNILQANGILPTLEGIDPNSEVARKVRKELELQEIALAALTADTSKLAELAAKVKKVREDAADFDGDRRGMWEHQEEQEQLLLEEAVKYTAPPAPVLRVPDGWIKCSERYPEVGQEVLIRIPVCEKFNIENGKYEGDGRFLGAWFDTRGKGRPYKVTHWMPLPPPPEASNER